MTWAMRIVQKPNCRPTLLKPCTKIVSRLAPRTISGVAIGTKTSMLPAARPRKRCLTSANASIVPMTVAMIVASRPILIEFPRAVQIPGGPQGFSQCLSVGEPSGFQAMFDFV